MYWSAMKVVEKDKMVSGMLKDEMDRCKSALRSLNKSMSGLRKGTIHVRKKKYKGKIYEYSYLKYRDGKGKSVSSHISIKDIENVSSELKKRAAIQREADGYQKRIAYLEKILKSK
jgi:hypothetical protein